MKPWEFKQIETPDGYTATFQRTYRAGQMVDIPCDKSGWIRVKDAMPDYAVRVQVVSKLHRFIYYDTFQRDRNGGHWSIVNDITHWQPAPELPDIQLPEFET